MWTSLLETRLFQDAVKCTRSKVIAGLSRYSDPPRLDRVLELAVAAPGCYEIPTVLVQHTEDLANLHTGRIPARLMSGKGTRSRSLTSTFRRAPLHARRLQPAVRARLP